MKRAGLLLIGVSLAACSQREKAPTATYRHVADQARTALRLDGICAEAPRDKNGMILSQSSFDNYCYRFEQPQIHQGVWLSWYVEGDYLPNAKTSPASLNDNDVGITLDINDDLLRRSHFDDHVGDRRAFLVRFIGRQTLYPGNTHMDSGEPHHIILVDKLLAIREIPVPPEQTRAS
ncbi:MAG: hypothetical protein ABI240_14940 [Sphingomonas sp.]